MTPRRIQLRRTKGWRKPAGAVVVARPSRWGNPFTVSATGSNTAAAAMFRQWITDPEQAALLAHARLELAGHDLACWCPPDQPCHADVLLDLANRLPRSKAAWNQN